MGSLLRKSSKKNIEKVDADEASSSIVKETRTIKEKSCILLQLYRSRHPCERRHTELKMPPNERGSLLNNRFGTFFPGSEVQK